GRSIPAPTLTRSISRSAPPAQRPGRRLVPLGARAGGHTPEGAIFLWAPGGVLTPVLRFDDPFDGGHFVRLGPPALNATGLLAFHGVVSSSDASDAGADGIFAVHGADVSILAQEGFSPLPLNQRLTAFGDPITVNDAGDVAFLAGPLVAP